MTSDMDGGTPSVAFVWVWLPGSTEPVVGGRLDDQGSLITFEYGRTYRDRREAISLYQPELPLRAGPQAPELGPLAGCIADAAPDAWGRRVIENRRVHGAGRSEADLPELAYLLESSSNRQGGLDFQTSPSDYQPRSPRPAALEELLEAAARVEAGRSLTPDLEEALLHGTSIGGARPKATLERGGRQYIAKFASTTDDRPVVKGEYLAMELARRAGLEVAPVELVRALDKDVLFVERFDRPEPGARRLVVSAHTILRLGPLGTDASYSDLADVVRARFVQPVTTLRELFSRISFSILVGNTDDHARNHAAFWDGSALDLTPAYDICPQRRTGNVASQAMAIGADGYRASQLAGCVDRAPTYGLSASDAQEIIDHQIEVVRGDWDEVCDLAEASQTDRLAFRGRQFLNPYALEGF